MIRKMVYSGIGMLFLSAVLVLAFQPKRIYFASPADFASWAKVNGIIVWPDPLIGDKYPILASTRQMNFAEIPFANPGEDKGVICIQFYRSSMPEPKQPYRVWGRVVAYGDPSMLDKVEKLR